VKPNSKKIANNSNIKIKALKRYTLCEKLAKNSKSTTDGGYDMLGLNITLDNMYILLEKTDNFSTKTEP